MTQTTKARLMNASMYPLVPLIRREEPSFGVLLHTEGLETTVFLCCLFDVASQAELLTQPKLEYASLDALFADGWKID